MYYSYYTIIGRWMARWIYRLYIQRNVYQAGPKSLKIDTSSQVYISARKGMFCVWSFCE